MQVQESMTHLEQLVATSTNQHLITPLEVSGRVRLLPLGAAKGGKNVCVLRILLRCGSLAVAPLCVCTRHHHAVLCCAVWLLCCGCVCRMSSCVTLPQSWTLRELTLWCGNMRVCSRCRQGLSTRRPHHRLRRCCRHRVSEQPGQFAVVASAAAVLHVCKMGPLYH